MTQQEQQILLKDLCGRLPFKPICRVSHKDSDGWKTEDLVLRGFVGGEGFFTGDYGSVYSSDFMPYLRPLSSMTEEECKILGNIPATIENIIEVLPNMPYFIEVARPEQIDWLNARLFDFRGLIEHGLALEAIDGMYNLNNE